LKQKSRQTDSRFDAARGALATAHGYAWCVPGSIWIIGKVRRRGDWLWRLHCDQKGFSPKSNFTVNSNGFD